MNSAEQVIDLSHTVSHGLITYKGLPAPIICDFLSREQSRQHYAPGTEFQIGKIEMVANTGTYLDSPFHRYEDGKDLSELELRSLANLDGILVKTTDPNEKALTSQRTPNRAIEVDVFRNLDVKGKAVLIYTGWDVNWETDQYFEGHPFLTKDAAQFLADQGAAIVGIDSYNIDDTADLTRPAHSILLGAGIPIVEHMCNLEELSKALNYPLATASGSVPTFKFFAVPVKIKGMGTFPLRAFVIVS